MPWEGPDRARALGPNNWMAPIIPLSFFSLEAGLGRGSSCARPLREKLFVAVGGSTFQGPKKHTNTKEFRENRREYEKPDPPIILKNIRKLQENGSLCKIPEYLVFCKFLCVEFLCVFFLLPKYIYIYIYIYVLGEENTWEAAYIYI